MIALFTLALGLIEYAIAVRIILARSGGEVIGPEEYFRRAPLEEVLRVVAHMNMGMLLTQLGAIFLAAGR